jgi:hypothetical protein
MVPFVAAAASGIANAAEGHASHVLIAASTTTANTDTSITFSGTVTPSQPGDVVVLQRETGSTDSWKTLATGTLATTQIGVPSTYSISYRWDTPGKRNVRVVFPAQNGGTTSWASRSVRVSISQDENAGFTITSQGPTVPWGSTIIISGNVSNIEPGQTAEVTLWARAGASSNAQFTEVGKTVTTGPHGHYSFPMKLTHSIVYFARTSVAPFVTTERVENVNAIVAMTASTETPKPGKRVTFTGHVWPQGQGHPIYMQQLQGGGIWTNVTPLCSPLKPVVLHTGPDSGFSCTLKVGRHKAGTMEFRARALASAENTAANSAPITLVVGK